MPACGCGPHRGRFPGRAPVPPRCRRCRWLRCTATMQERHTTFGERRSCRRKRAKNGKRTDRNRLQHRLPFIGDTPTSAAHLKKDASPHAVHRPPRAARPGPRAIRPEPYAYPSHLPEPYAARAPLPFPPLDNKKGMPRHTTSPNNAPSALPKGLAPFPAHVTARPATAPSRAAHPSCGAPRGGACPAHRPTIAHRN